MLFANGIGFSSAGGVLAPTLLINQTTTGPITFADETAARLPAGFMQQGKGLVVADVDNDGDQDVAFANGFLNQPSLLINNGTGVFTNETATRFPVLSLNSFGGGFGDVDDDGDIDLVFADAGPSAFGAPGGMVRLFLNNGAGVFANTPLQMNAANKVGSQNAQVLDVDNDFDLDVVVDGKSAGQQLYLNNGAGTYTLQASTLPAGTSNTYATDFSDLDNDNDLDAVYISLGGFNEGTAQNNLVPSGTLGFTGSQATMNGPTGQDDNDVIFLDADDDGIQDAIVGSLSNNREILYRNAGTFGTPSFVFDVNGFSAQADSTLDLATADFDGDARYDIVTGQGESGNFTNRVYRNTGARGHARTAHRPRAAHAAARSALGDPGRRPGPQGLDPGRDLQARPDLRARARRRHGGEGRRATGLQHADAVRRRRPASRRHPAVCEPHRPGRHGRDLDGARDPIRRATRATARPPRSASAARRATGWVAINSTGVPGTMAGVGDPGIAANNFSVTMANLPPNQPGVLLVGTAKVDPASPFRAKLHFIGGTVQQVATTVSNGSGQASILLDFTQPPFGGVTPGATLYLQFHYADVTLPSATNALEVVFCD